MGIDDKRSATDILLDIENKLSSFDKRIQNSENLLKILLSRLNTALSSGVSIQSPQSPQSQYQVPPQPVNYVPAVVNKDNFESRQKTSKFAEAAAGLGIDTEDDIEPVDPFEIDEFKTKSIPKDDGAEDMLEAPSRGNSRGQRGPKIKGAKCSVSQSLNSDNSPIYLANVELLDENGSLINQTRTNTKGRWMMALAPGSYQVHVLKRFPSDSGKKSIDVTYPIVIPQSDKPVELNPLTLSNGNP